MFRDRETLSLVKHSGDDAVIVACCAASRAKTHPPTTEAKHQYVCDENLKKKWAVQINHYL